MANLPINGLDLAVGIVLLISALLAFMRGFVHEVLSIAAWVGAVLAAVHGLPFARPFARSIISIDWVADSAAAVLIFLVVLLVLSIITNAIARSIQKSALNNLDRSLGFVFGLARALVILGVGLIIADWLTAAERPIWMKRAKTLPIIELTAEGLKAILPPTFMAGGDAAKDGAAKINKAIEVKETAKETLDRLTAPTPQGPAAETAKPESGYQDKERRDMERLIQTNEGLNAPSDAGEGGSK
jgi:membrane protein required for colicin V production